MPFSTAPPFLFSAPKMIFFTRIIDMAVAHIGHGSKVMYIEQSHNLVVFRSLDALAKTFISACSSAFLPYSEVLCALAKTLPSFETNTAPTGTSSLAEAFFASFRAKSI